MARYVHADIGNWLSWMVVEEQVLRRRSTKAAKWLDPSRVCVSIWRLSGEGLVQRAENSILKNTVRAENLGNCAIAASEDSKLRIEY